MSRNIMMPKLETKAQEIKVQVPILPHPDYPFFSTPKSLLHGSRGISWFHCSLIPLNTYMQCWKSFCYHLPPTDLQHVRQDSKPVSLLSGWTCAFKKPHKELSQDPDQVQMQTLPEPGECFGRRGRWVQQLAAVPQGATHLAQPLRNAAGCQA